MRGFLVAAIRFVWRKMFLPVIGLLPVYRQMQVRTLAHHAKMTLAHGQVIEFDRFVGAKLSPSPSVPEAELPPVISEPLPASATSSLLPAWMVDELRSLSSIEPDLFPSPDLLGRFVAYTPPMELGPGQVYAECCLIIGNLSPDIIFLIPWLIPGGADQGVLYHVEAALAAGKKALVISTIDRESSWMSRLPEQAKCIELGILGRELSEAQRLSVLTRVVLQSPARVIHIVNSPLGWEMLKQYGRSLIAVDKRVFASVFCDDYNHYGAIHSYAQMYFVDCWKFLQGVMCDTRWYPQDLARQYGVSLDKITTVYFPVNFHNSPVYRAASVPRVLWAGRFCKQKRVDLLIEIARFLPEINFAVYGYATNEYEHDLEKQLHEQANITVHGKFDSLRSVVDGGVYSLFLFTSGWEGLPITLLDATIAGLPIVASAVGGVPEFVTEKTGYPVWEVGAPGAYVNCIREAMADEFTRRKKWESAVELVLSRHTVEYFSEQLKGVPGYFTDEVKL